MVDEAQSILVSDDARRNRHDDDPSGPLYCVV